MNTWTRLRATGGVLLVTAVGLLPAVGCATPGNEPSSIAADQPTVSPVTPASTTLAPVVSGELAAEALGNATFRGLADFDEPVTLSGGRYEGEPFVEGGASRPTVALLPEPPAYGDLDGDGQADAAVLLVSESGGSGTFVHLAAVEAIDGGPVNTATLLLGDRVQVASLNIDGDRLLVRLLTHGPDDPACCPTLETTRAFRLQEGQWVENAE